MTLARIVGTVVSSKRADDIRAARYLLVQVADESGRRQGETLVALDLVGAGYDELVMLCQGGSCRWANETVDKPIDTVIVGIVDCIDAADTVSYRKQ